MGVVDDDDDSVDLGAASESLLTSIFYFLWNSGLGFKEAKLFKENKAVCCWALFYLK